MEFFVLNEKNQFKNSYRSLVKSKEQCSKTHELVHCYFLICFLLIIEYPQIKPTNPLYTSTNTIKTAASAVSRTSRASTMNTVSRRQKYNPNKPRRINDWRWVSALAVLLFFPTGLIAIGLAIKARTKFEDGFIDQAKVLNKRALLFCIVSFVFGIAWLLTAFFLMDRWPRTNG